MIEHRTMSLSQFGDLCAFEPERFIGVEVDRKNGTVTVLLEGDEMAQTSGTMPQLSDNTIRRKPRKGKKS